MTAVLKIQGCVVYQCYLMSIRLQEHFGIFINLLNMFTQMYLIILHGAGKLCQISLK